ncbi:integrin alpha-3 isoform X1 [Pygocentrus nattereri]|uniref:integrin alpha-3 isoform X1 n=1 Tax=Pygocentrus nattereri TaxID=42514 RepID=UPI001891A0FA|nr:integrin alpha-3 isoform X1 [Pygocentrus nattereri]
MKPLRQSCVDGSTLILCLIVPLSCCFNVDSRFAVLKHSDSPGSLFGLSVALHQQTISQNRYLMLVGAPKERAEPKLQANRTGDMFACPINTNPKDCQRANLISSDPPDSDGIVDGMWLGVSVVSQPQPGGRVMACGHRYKRTMDGGNTLRMIGKCYVRGNDLTFDPNKDYDWQYKDEVCNPFGDQSQEGLCLMGISAAITQTDSIVGAPGCYNWQGNSFVIYRNPTTSYSNQKMKFPDMNRGNIYIGYSVAKDSGVLNSTEDTVVSGAPRDDSKGSVILARVVQRAGTESDLETQQILKGQQVGSYFGNSIAIVDLNNDGWKELIVGAPFYFDRKKEEGGAVYVFMNENGSFQLKTDRKLTGPKQSGFGMAVAAVGDVNQDGFQDFAVGAPYYGSGRVYIWLGSKSGPSNQHSQVIEGKDITNGGFKTFGYSISGGLDVDDNKYPDMVVGSLDDKVALLRARPVIHLQKTFTVTPQIVNSDDCDSCIEVKVCFSYTVSTGDQNLKKDIKVAFTVDADLLQRSTRSRVQFLDTNKDTYTGSLSMPSCQTLKLRLMNPIRNKVAPLVFSLNISLFEPQPDSQQQLQNLDAFPVISQGEALTDRAEIHFKKECGPDNKCESNLQMTATFASGQQELLPAQGDHQVLLFNSEVKKVTVLVNVSNVPSAGRLAEDAYNTILNITIPPSLQYSAVRTESAAVQCSLEGIAVLCELGDPFRSNQRKEFGIIFETPGISLDTREIEVILQLSTFSIQNDLKPLTKVLMVEYTLQTLLNVQPTDLRVEFSGEVVGESAMKSTSDIGSPVEFNFAVNMEGKPLGSLGFLQVVFDWPSQVENEKWLLYLVEIQMSGTSESVCSPKGDIINPLHYTVSERNSVRRKRDESSVIVHPEPQASLNLQSARRRNVQLSCGSGAKCQTFSCPLNNMTNPAKLRVRARLWNSTMLEDYKDSETRITGQATLQLITDKPAIRMDNTSVTFTVIVTPAGQTEVLYEVPLWIIIVSVLAGVVLLGLIILLLWKCGFFRRAVYFRRMSKYHGVRVCKEERYSLSQGFLIQQHNKKHWITNWTETQQNY